jgi:hypothetical protein
MATTSVKYANDEYVAKIVEKQISDQSKLNAIISEKTPSLDKYNSLFPVPTNITTATADELVKLENEYRNTYTFGAFRIIADANLRKQTANVACIVPPENATQNTVNMTKIDNGAYHTFNTCSNKGNLMNKKYFSLVKPPTESGVTDPNLYECWVGDDPLINNTASTNSYYQYITIWSLGPGVTQLEIDQKAGDIIITANDINSLGITQKKYSTETVTYKYAQGAYLQPNTFANMDTYIFDINQATIIGANINGGLVGKDVPISQITYVNGSNDQVIVSAKDSQYVRMIKLQIARGDGITPGLPYDNSLYIKPLEARNNGSINGGANRYVRITAACGNDNWLQIAQVQVFDNNGVNVALNKPVEEFPNRGPWRTPPRLVVDGTASPRGYPYVYHSGTDCNASITIDLLKDTPISKIVVYNRADCCSDRLLGATLECLAADKKTQLYTTSMTHDMIQTYKIKSKNTVNDTIDINELWNKSTTVSLVTDGTKQGIGINSLVVQVTPYAAGKGETGYSKNNEAKLALSQNSYKTLNDTTKEQCRTACDNDSNCYGYTTTGAKNRAIETGLTDLGCYKDDWNRALLYYNGNGQNKDTCLAAAKQNNHKYFGLQYYGYCFSTNDDSVATGYARYGPDTRPCATLGIDWQNHVYRRNFTSSETTVCNLYGKSMDGTTVAAPASTVATRTITEMPVNNSTLNLTNNEMTNGLGICGSTCNAYLELGNDGNLKLYKPPDNATGTVSSTSSGKVLWDLFDKYPDTQKIIKSIVPIGESSWKQLATQSSKPNTLSKGDNLTTKRYLISNNGQFMLQIADGYIKLKAAVYGCFSSSSDSNNTDALIYTNASLSGPQSFYVYQNDLSHTRSGNIYHASIKKSESSDPSDTQIGIRNITENKIVKNSNMFQDISRMNYMPFNDTSPTVINANVDECKKECIATENCNYIYTKNGDCKLGNRNLPAFVPNPSNTDKYNLFLRTKELNIEAIPPGSIFSNIKLNNRVEDTPFLLGKTIVGPDINNITENMTTIKEKKNMVETATIGYLANPLGKAIYQQSRARVGENVDIERRGNPPQSIQTRSDPYGDPPTPVDYNSQTLIGTAASVVSGFRNMEGFDTHGWKPVGQNCGQLTKEQCYPGILYGQIRPLQSISNDYSAKMNKINSNYLDISNNISKYKIVYNDISDNAIYDFSGTQQIVLNGPTDLLTEMKNDSKQLALQTNNMYIAGSILTTTLLISAIYLGRS